MDDEQNQNLTLKERRELKRQEKLARKTAEEGKHSSNRLWLWFSVVIILVGVVFALVKIAKTPGDSTLPQTTTILETIVADDWITDNTNASTTLIEYSDFECPACGSWFPILEEIHKEFGSDIRFVYRHFPLTQHVNARLSARAAEAAGTQGKFWEMHDMLFAMQKEWSAKGNAEKLFEGYAETLGLNLEQFRKEYRSKETGNRIDRDVTSGIRFGVDSTPTFFINDVKYNFRSNNELRRVLQEVIASTTAAGTIK